MYDLLKNGDYKKPTKNTLFKKELDAFLIDNYILLGENKPAIPLNQAIINLDELIDDSAEGSSEMPSKKADRQYTTGPNFVGHAFVWERLF